MVVRKNPKIMEFSIVITIIVSLALYAIITIFRAASKEEISDLESRLVAQKAVIHQLTKTLEQLSKELALHHELLNADNFEYVTTTELKAKGKK